MRLLFEDRAFAAAYPAIRIDQVGLPQGSSGGNRRDLWFRFVGNAGTPALTVYAFGTRAEASVALADLDPTTALASRTWVALPNGGTWTLTDVAGTSPNMTGLQIQANMTDWGPAEGVVWMYTSAPDIVVADNMKTIALLYNGAGQALAGVESENISVGLPPKNRALPSIWIIPQPLEFDLRRCGDQLMAFYAPIKVEVQTRSLRRGGDVWKDCRAFQGALQSIFMDEWCNSYGEAALVQNGPPVGPIPASKDQTVFGATVNLRAQFPSIWRDQKFPR